LTSYFKANFLLTFCRGIDRFKSDIEGALLLSFYVLLKPAIQATKMSSYWFELEELKLVKS